MTVSMHLRGKVEAKVHKFEASIDQDEFVELTVREGPYPGGVVHLFFQGSQKQFLEFANDLREAALNLDAETLDVSEVDKANET
jgi:hypothetical protein